MKEEKIASFQQEKTRLQLLKITCDDIGTDGMPTDLSVIKYQLRLNRKIIGTSISEYAMRKVFATKVQNIVLQLKMF